MPEVSHIESETERISRIHHDVDDWFAANCREVHVHWDPREIVFQGEMNGQTSPGAEASTFFAERGISTLIEIINGRSRLTVRLPLAAQPSRRLVLHAGLFILTFITTFGCGGLCESPFFMAKRLHTAATDLVSWLYKFKDLAFPESVRNGLLFSVPLLTILLAHELGHYFVARRYRMNVTLPFFLPSPLGIGTFGAVIVLRSPMTHRRAVFDVGIAGPLAGMIVTLPVLFFGLKWSIISQVTSGRETYVLELGESILFKIMAHFAIGPLGQNQVIVLHPMALAGWLGLFVTALNLLPVGQLDGGHVIYAMFGRAHGAIACFAFSALVVLSVAYSFPDSLAYALFAIVVFFFVKLRHPPAIDETVRINAWRYILGAAAIALFVMTFVPVPIRTVKMS